MMQSISDLNVKYALGRPRVMSQRYDDDGAFRLAKLITSIKSDPAFLTVELLENFRIKLYEILLFARSGLWTEEKSRVFWTDKAERITTEFHEVRHVLEPKTLELFDELADYLVGEATLGANARALVVARRMSNHFKSYVLIAPRASVARVAGEWLADSGLSDRAMILSSMRELSALSRNFFDELIYLGGCMNFINRQNWDRYLRVLFLGAVSKNHVFVSPSWQKEAEEPFVLQKLLFEMAGQISLDWRIEDEPVEDAHSDSSAVSEALLEIDGAEVPVTSINSVDRLRTDGPIECKIVELPNDLTYAVEVDSDRITTLELLPDGKARIAFRKFAKVQQGELVVARWDAAEAGALRDIAFTGMGPNAAPIILSQSEWKSRLMGFMALHGEREASRRLELFGVVHFERANYWIEETTLGPQLNSDFANLLAALDFNSDEISEHQRCKTALLRGLIKAGQLARASLLESISIEDRELLENNKPVIITLHDLGEAQYLIAPVVGIMPGISKCSPSQIRKATRK